MFPFVLSLLCSRGDVVSGLHKGETALVLAANVVVEKEQPFTFLRPRILDAATGAPLANACLEAWTESGMKGIGLEICIDRTLTQRDGTARLRARLGAATTEKVRISCPGHASRTVSVSDTFGEILLFDSLPLEGRVLDLEDHPVANALVRTRETCSHAIPAAQTRTDAFGRFHLEDCPVEEGGPELEVIGDDIGPLCQLDVGHLRALGALYGEIVLRVARREPLKLRVVDHEGTPVAGRRVVQRNLPTAEAWTDAEGNCTLPPLAEGREPVLYLNDVGVEVALTAGPFPAGLASTVCPCDVPDSRRTGRVHVKFEGAIPADENLHAWAFGARGEVEMADEDRILRVVPGPARIALGAPFSGWRAEVRDIVVGDEPVTVRFAPQREPVLRVKLPPDSTPAFVAIQAGADSIHRELDQAGTAECMQGVPPGVPLVALLETHSGEVRRLVHAPITSDAEIDLTQPATVIRRVIRPTAHPQGQLRCAILDDTGIPIEGLTGKIVVPDFQTGDEPLEGPGPFFLMLPSRFPYRLEFRAGAYPRGLHCEGLVPATDAPLLVREFVMHRGARLELRGAIDAIDVGGPEPDAVEGGFDLDAAPGPLMLRIGRKGAPPLALDLVLAEGETRRIDVH